MTTIGAMNSSHGPRRLPAPGRASTSASRPAGRARRPSRGRRTSMMSAHVLEAGDPHGAVDARRGEQRARARSGSKRGTMSGVWPWSAGGTRPPVATSRFAGRCSPSASRSIACASARRKSHVRDHRVACGRTRDTPSRRQGRSTASACRRAGDPVGEARRVADGDHVELAARRTAASRRRSCRARYSTRSTLPRRRVRVVGAALEHEASRRRARRSRNGAAHDLPTGVGPVVSVALDRVARLRAAVGAVHDAQEVRRRRGQPELDGPVVERAHADADGVARAGRGSSPGRSRARSRSRPTSRALAGRARA